jgi:hypothetical protein
LFSEYTGVKFIQVKSRKDYILWDFIQSSGIYLKFGLCRIPVYTVFGLDRFHCAFLFHDKW